jgi:dTMP kinase
MLNHSIDHMYIVFEGTVGTGKSTQAKKLFEYLKQKYPNKEIILTREPGGTEISESIRQLVQGTNFNEKMNPITEAYLYASSRAQSLRLIVKPVLDNGGIVISDRTFISSLAYQGFARELGVDKILKINEVAIKGFYPDRILFLKLNPEIGLSRTFDKDGDKFEKENVSFFNKIEEGYMKLSEMNQFHNSWQTIDASGNINQVFDRILNTIKKINFN